TFFTSADTVVGRTTTDVMSNKSITLTAGSTSQAPLTFTSGTNLTTATAGAEEYDGTVFYSTPVASARSISPSEMFCAISGDFTLQAASGVQTAFGTACDVWTLAATTTYEFWGQYHMTTGTTSH